MTRDATINAPNGNSAGRLNMSSTRQSPIGWGRSIGRVRILLVHEPGSYRATIVQWLEMLDEVGRLEISGFGLDALRMIDANRPDAVLVAAALPDMSAYSFTRAVKAMQHPPVVVILNGIESANIAGVAKRAGADYAVGWSELRIALPSFLRDCAATLAAPHPAAP